MDPTSLKLRRASKTDIPGPLRQSSRLGIAFGEARVSEASTFSARGGSAFGGNAAGATLGPVNETNMTRIWNKHKQTNTPLKRKVFVGLSGGVDSSVSAALLKKQGYDVTGVFIKVWQPDFIACTWKEDRLDAMRVCAKLGIPFVTLDLSKEYKKEVVDYMIDEYKRGRTPNPDVMCNKHVKFGGFYEFARSKGADYVATGHYARVMEHGACPPDRRTPVIRAGNTEHKKKRRSDAPCYMLHVACDLSKDQSYFLWTLSQEQLAHTLFPVGDLEKPEVRKLAKKLGLPTADKKDSQGLCFLGKIDVKEFLKSYIKPKAGKVLNEKGEVIGEHDGAFFFTLGERHNFRVNKKTSSDKPYYVVGKDVKKNTLTVSHDPKAEVEGKSGTMFEIGHLNWISGVPAAGTPLLVRIRYRQPFQPARFMIPRPSRNGTFGRGDSPPVPKRYVRAGKLLILFASPQTGAAGQSIVLYDGEVCLGGGVIV